MWPSQRRGSLELPEWEEKTSSEWPDPEKKPPEPCFEEEAPASPAPKRGSIAMVPLGASRGLPGRAEGQRPPSEATSLEEWIAEESPPTSGDTLQREGGPLDSDRLDSSPLDSDRMRLVFRAYEEEAEREARLHFSREEPLPPASAPFWVPAPVPDAVHPRDRPGVSGSRVSRAAQGFSLAPRRAPGRPVAPRERDQEPPPAAPGQQDLFVHPVLRQSAVSAAQARANAELAARLAKAGAANPLRLQVMVHGNPGGRAREHKAKPPAQGWYVPGSAFQPLVRQQLQEIRGELRRTVFADVFDSTEEFSVEGGASEDEETFGEEEDDHQGLAPAGSSVPDGLSPALPYLLGNRRGRFRIRHPCDAVPVLLEYLRLLPSLASWDLERLFERFGQLPAKPVPGARELPEHLRRPPKVPGLGVDALEALAVAYFRSLVDLLPEWIEWVFLQARKLLLKRVSKARKRLKQVKARERKLLKLQQAAPKRWWSRGEEPSSPPRIGRAQPKSQPKSQPKAQPKSPAELAEELAAFAYDLRRERDLDLAGQVLERMGRDARCLRDHVRFRLVELQRWTYTTSRRLFSALDRNRDGRVSRIEFLSGWGAAATQMLVQELQLEALFPLHCHREAAGSPDNRGARPPALAFGQETSAELSPMLLYLPLIDPRCRVYNRNP